MFFYILSRYKITSLEYNSSNFISDDLVDCIISKNSIIATDDLLDEMRSANAGYDHVYRVSVENVKGK
jgi:hypothetical protein